MYVCIYVFYIKQGISTTLLILTRFFPSSFPQLVYWEDKTLFIEQKFITLSDGFVRAVVLSRQNLINIDADTLLKNIPGAEVKPECPEEIKHWLEAIEISSARLRKKD